MIVTCQECNAAISDSAVSCPKCGAPPDAYLGARHNCAECGTDYHPAYPECRSCGAPRDIALGESEINFAAQPRASERVVPLQSAKDTEGRPNSSSNPEIAPMTTYRDPTLGNIFSFEGRTVEYRSLDEIARALAAGFAAENGTARRPSMTFASFSRGDGT